MHEPPLSVTTGERALLERYRTALEAFRVHPNRRATRTILALERRLRRLKAKYNV